jgi:transposase
MSRPPITDEQLAALPPEFQSLVRAIMDHYERQIVELKSRIDQLEARLGMSPQNSSLPPSSQHPHARPTPKKPRSKKKRGAQPGHKKHERPLRPTDQCDDVQSLKPSQCRRCGERLAGKDPAPLRHQVWELPEIRPLVTEYQRHRLTCLCCGTTTCAPLPPGVPTGQSGPRLIAFSALLMAYFRQSKRRTALFLEALLGQPCSTGLVVKQQTLATQALRPTYEKLASGLPRQPYIRADETATKEAHRKSWLWTLAAERFTVFAVRPSRGGEVPAELLGEDFAGVVSCDRAKMYWQFNRLQWCWAHLKRDFQALIDSASHQAKRLGRDLMRPVKELFRHWSRCRDGTITRRGLKRLTAPIRERIENLLLRGVFSGNRLFVGMCRELYDHRDWLWTFLDVEGVEPTNNAAERALRHAVIWRKLSFGTQSAAGSRFVETMLTVIETCRQQATSVFDYVAHAITAHIAGRPGKPILTRA